MFAAFRIWGAALGLVLGSLGLSSTAVAGHPWGLGHGHFHHGHYHGFGYGFGGYRPLSVYPTSLWGGGYAWSGYSGLGYGRLSYRGWDYRGWHARPVGYTSFYANYYLPMTIYPRVAYYAPTAAYYVPTYSEPSYCPPGLINYENYEPGVVVPSDYMPAYCDTCNADSESAISGALQLSSDATDGIPADLLASADAIFQAGGYQQAATAYAQLHVRYGSSDLIFGRRFVAQVASGDYDQAAVVLVSAQGAGFPIDRSVASVSDWSQLLAPHGDAITAWTESLAQHALQSQSQHGVLSGDQHEALELMATWLNLTGQPERAGLFLAMAERLANEESQPQPTLDAFAAAEELPTPSHAPSVLVLRQE